MARPTDTDRYDLSDAEKHDLSKVINEGEFIDFEERWTGACIFEAEWQSFRARHSRDLEWTTATHACPNLGRDTIAVKMIDIFGNDTMTLVPITAG